MNEPEPEKYKFSVVKFLLWLPVYLLIGFVLYVLSAGPFYWLIYEAFFFNENPYIASLYLPLVVLSSAFEPFGRWLEWYIGLWVL